jgi:hypothetical protein
MGLLTEKLPSNEYIPKDFSEERTLSLELGYNLHKIIDIHAL